MFKVYDKFKLKEAKKDYIQYGKLFMIQGKKYLKTLKRIGKDFFFIGYMPEQV